MRWKKRTSESFRINITPKSINVLGYCQRYATMIIEKIKKKDYFIHMDPKKNLLTL
jgi:hypothetical protein